MKSLVTLLCLFGFFNVAQADSEKANIARRDFLLKAKYKKCKLRRHKYYGNAKVGYDIGDMAIHFKYCIKRKSINLACTGFYSATIMQPSRLEILGELSKNGALNTVVTTGLCDK